MLDQVVAELRFDLVLCVSEALSYQLVDFIVWKLAQVLRSARVLHELGHLTHGKARHKMAVQAMPIENSEYFDILLAINIILDNREERVLIDLGVLPFLAGEFNILKLFLIVSFKVLQNVLSVQNGLRIVEQDLVLPVVLGIPQVIDPSGDQHVLILAVDLVAREQASGFIQHLVFVLLHHVDFGVRHFIEVLLSLALSVRLLLNRQLLHLC
jgi:hypothetical protein